MLKLIPVLVLTCTSLTAADRKPLIVFRGNGSVQGTVENINPAWAFLKFEWASACPGPYLLTLTAFDKASQINRSILLASHLDNIGANGVYLFPLPDKTTAVTIDFQNGACQASETVTAYALDSTQWSAKPKRQKPERAAEFKMPKQRKPPSQSPITQECVYVYDIYSHSLNAFSGLFTAEPGIEAKIQNNCGQTAEVFLRIGYFDSRGVQFGDGIGTASVAAGAQYDLYHAAQLYGLNRGLLKQARIISVQAYPR